MQHKITTLTPYSVDHEGRAIARDLDNRVILIEKALPRSTVRAEIKEYKKNYALAEVFEVLKPSLYAISPKCSHFEDCGGCTWQNVDYKEQLVYKRQIFLDALTRIGKLAQESLIPKVSTKEHNALSEIAIEPSDKIYGYRTKMEFAFGTRVQKGKESLVLGLKSAKSHTVVPVDCRLTSPFVNTLIERLAELMRSFLPVFEQKTEGKSSGFLRYAVTREIAQQTKNKTAKRDFLLEIITYPIPEYNQKLYEICRQVRLEFPEVSIVHSTRKNLLPIAYGEKTIASFGAKKLYENLPIQASNCKDKKCEFTLKLAYTHQSFFQVNTNMTSLLYSRISQAVLGLDIKSIADIYCGVGGLGICLAQAFKMQDKAIKLYGLENMPHAVELARENAKNAQISTEDAEFVQGNAKNLSSFLKGKKIDLFVLDPPRAGIDKESMQTLLRIKAPYLLLVSCNPASLARDLAILMKDSLYEIENMQAFDFFPHTPHVESFVLLKKK